MLGTCALCVWTHLILYQACKVDEEAEAEKREETFQCHPADPKVNFLFHKIFSPFLTLAHQIDIWIQEDNKYKEKNPVHITGVSKLQPQSKSSPVTWFCILCEPWAKSGFHSFK